MNDHDTTLEDLRATLKEAEEALTEAERARDDWEPDSDDGSTGEAYDNMLDEVHGEFLGMSASRILKECDPIAYRCGFNDWADGEMRNERQKRDTFPAYDALCEAVEDAEAERDEAQEALDEAEADAE